MFAFIADALTFSRVFFAGFLIWLGTRGPDTLPVAIGATVLAWTTDQLDGWAARRATTRTRLAGFDFPIDTTLYLGQLLYLMQAGYLPWEPGLTFVLATAASWGLTRRKAVVVLSLRIFDLVCGAVLFIHTPRIAMAVVGWLAVLAVLYRRRLAERVPRWISELLNLAGYQRR